VPTAKKKSTTPLWEQDVLDGYTMPPEAIVSQLVGSSVFPGVGPDDVMLRIELQIRGDNEDYKDHAKALFKLLLAAITKLHGKPDSQSAKSKSWEHGGREIHLWFIPNANPGDVQMAEVRLRSRPITPA
jgi:hypothetical protein